MILLAHYYDNLWLVLAIVASSLIAAYVLCIRMMHGEGISIGLFNGLVFGPIALACIGVFLLMTSIDERDAQRDIQRRSSSIR